MRVGGEPENNAKEVSSHFNNFSYHKHPFSFGIGIANQIAAVSLQRCYGVLFGQFDELYACIVINQA